jgi:hypothetical protein
MFNKFAFNYVYASRSVALIIKDTSFLVRIPSPISAGVKLTYAAFQDETPLSKAANIAMMK